MFIISLFLRYILPVASSPYISLLLLLVPMLVALCLFSRAFHLVSSFSLALPVKPMHERLELKTKQPYWVHCMLKPIACLLTVCPWRGDKYLESGECRRTVCQILKYILLSYWHMWASRLHKHRDSQTQDTSVDMSTCDEWMVDTPSVASCNWRVLDDHAGTKHAQGFGLKFVTPPPVLHWRVWER